MMTIVMMALAMSGLTYVQIQLLRNAWHLKEQAFDRNAVAALSLTVKQLETADLHREAVARIGENLMPDNDGAEIIVRQINFDGEFSSEMVDVGVDTIIASDQSLRVFFAGERQHMIHKVVGDLILQTPRAFSERADKADIDSLLLKNLETVGIATSPLFAVLSSPGDSIVLTSFPSDDFSANDAPYRAKLFPLDFLPPSLDLVLFFPGRTGFLINEILPFAVASLIFMAVVLISFWLNLRMISEQRRASISMVDFINNMTHEFKTPISTVNLASEAIAGEEFSNCPESLKRYNDMIRQETSRMSTHAERILQFAYLEEGDFELNETTVAMHQTIVDSCAAFQLAMQNRGGELHFNLEASTDLIPGDGEHLTNVVTNLVDNAIKYSPDSPRVELNTSISSDWFVLEVSDSGLGISPEDQSRVFERYFRCSTGDRHDVKGFGLGLSYVRLLVHAHQGKIELKSRSGHGTSIRIFLPLKRKGAARG